MNQYDISKLTDEQFLEVMRQERERRSAQGQQQPPQQQGYGQQPPAQGGYQGPMRPQEQPPAQQPPADGFYGDPQQQMPPEQQGMDPNQQLPPTNQDAVNQDQLSELATYRMERAVRASVGQGVTEGTVQKITYALSALGVDATREDWDQMAPYLNEMLSALKVGQQQSAERQAPQQQKVWMPNQSSERSTPPQNETLEQMRARHLAGNAG